MIKEERENLEVFIKDDNESFEIRSSHVEITFDTKGRVEDLGNKFDVFIKWRGPVDMLTFYKLLWAFGNNLNHENALMKFYPYQSKEEYPPDVIRFVLSKEEAKDLKELVNYIIECFDDFLNAMIVLITLGYTY